MIVQRIKAYIDAKNISISAFEKMVGLSNGTFRKSYEGNKAIKSDVLEEVFAIFEDISPIWLLTGEGEMIEKKESNNVEPVQGDIIKYLQSMLETKDQIIREQAEELGRLREQVRQLEIEKTPLEYNVEDADTSYTSQVG